MSQGRKIEVVDYRDAWPALFAEEAEQIKAVLGDEAVRLHHVGSTSVPGLRAKPILDILVEVRDIERIDAYNGAMAKLGYLGNGENGIPERRYFQKGGDDRTHHVHMFEQGHPEAMRHLLFRDYLRAHPEAVQQYGDIKTEGARLYTWDINGYMAHKHDLIRHLLDKAAAWDAGGRLQER